MSTYLFEQEYRSAYMKYMQGSDHDTFVDILERFYRCIKGTYGPFNEGPPPTFDMWIVDHRHPENFCVPILSEISLDYVIIGHRHVADANMILVPLMGISAVHALLVPLKNKLYIADNWSRWGTVVVHPDGSHNSSLLCNRQLLTVPLDQPTTIRLGPIYSLLINPDMCIICCSKPRICRFRCGHVVCCPSCIYKLERCCICRTSLRPALTISPDLTVNMYVSPSPFSLFENSSQDDLDDLEDLYETVYPRGLTSSRGKRPRQWSPEMLPGAPTYMASKAYVIVE